MNYVFLRDTPSAIPCLAEWQYSEWGDLNPGDSVDARIVRLQKHIDTKGLPETIVALDGDIPIGSAALIPQDMDTRPELSPWLASVYVREDRRNQGVGTELERRVCQYARERDHGSVFLFTPVAKDFYTRLGWKVVEECEYRDQEVVLMTKRLTP